MKKIALGMVQTLALTSAFAQPARFWLATTIGRADTVWLIHHDDLSKSHQDLAGNASRKGNDVQPVTANYLDSMKRLPVENQLLLGRRLNRALDLQQKGLLNEVLCVG